MSDNRLGDYLVHTRHAASDATDFVDGIAKADFLVDRRSQQAVIMSLVILGEAATKIMDRWHRKSLNTSDFPGRLKANQGTGHSAGASCEMQFPRPCCVGVRLSASAFLE